MHISTSTSAELRDFYPPVEPYNQFFLEVTDGHRLYVEEVGNSKGVPVVFLHGGPGGGISPDHRRYFDPERYRVILFDQRGCGRSIPFASLENNTTWHLVADIEVIRKHLGIEKWIVFGGSWGSTLALSYAVTHAERVQALVLRGIFLCRPSEIQWFYQNGASQIFPDNWDRYYEYIPENERNDLVKAYYQRLTHADARVRIEAAKIWSQWEAATSYLIPKSEAVQEFEDSQKALAFARIEAHYFINNAFFTTDNYLLENVNKIQKIPGYIVQGRYDVVCPARSAWDLHKAWTNSQLKIISNAGHAASEEGIRSQLISWMDALK